LSAITASSSANDSDDTAIANEKKKVRTIASIETLVRLLEKLPSLQSVEDLLPRRNGRPKSAD